MGRKLLLLSLSMFALGIAMHAMPLEDPNCSCTGRNVYNIECTGKGCPKGEQMQASDCGGILFQCVACGITGYGVCFQTEFTESNSVGPCDEFSSLHPPGDPGLPVELNAQIYVRDCKGGYVPIVWHDQIDSQAPKKGKAQLVHD